MTLRLFLVTGWNIEIGGQKEELVSGFREFYGKGISTFERKCLKC